MFAFPLINMILNEDWYGFFKYPLIIIKRIFKKMFFMKKNVTNKFQNV